MVLPLVGPLDLQGGRAFAVKVVPKRLPVFPFSGLDLYHHFRNDAFYDLYNLLKDLARGIRCRAKSAHIRQSGPG